MFIALQMILIVLFSVLFVSLIKNSKLKFVILGLCVLFVSAQFNSIILGGELIDFKFYQHFNIETALAVKSVFIWQVIKTLLFGLLMAYTIYRISILSFMSELNTYIKISSLFFLGVLMCIDGGVFSKLYEIYSLTNTVTNKNFGQTLNTIGNTNTKYITSENIEVNENNVEQDSIGNKKKQKNIIVISIESLERGYLSDNLAHLTPNLRKMAKEMTFFNMTMGSGSDWTAGSVYTEITGFPCFFKNQGNEIFQGVSSTKISGLGHILTKAGYDLNYVLAQSDFAGMRDMLTANKFNVVSEDKFSPNVHRSDWGTHDKDLFNEVKKLIKKKQTGNKPFAVFMSTLDTHPPDGLYDKTMEKILPQQKTKLEFMASAIDYYVSDLMKFLKKENLIDNTVIYIFPDHQLMGTESDVINRFPVNRGLFLLTNVKQNTLSYDIRKSILQIDIPKIILEGAEIKHNVKFFTDLIPQEDKLGYIAQHKQEILKINESSLIHPSNKIKQGQILNIGHRIYSQNSKFSLILQTDGNLVIYKDLHQVVWSTNTFGTFASKFYLNKNGILSLTDNKNKILWQSKNLKKIGEFFILGDDGKLKLYNYKNEIIWESIKH